MSHATTSQPSGVLPDIAARAHEYGALRRQIHAHPELGYEEVQTSALVADTLARSGIAVHRGLGRTGVVGTIRRGTSSRVIGLRADMDALPMEEGNAFTHRSQHAGRFHGCGHDGHTAMLLAAAEYLATRATFDGAVHLIFQPAEEGLRGAEAMIRDGLFEHFPCDAVYGMHNFPSLAVNRFAVRAGPLLGSLDEFTLTITGVGGHAGIPQAAIDPVVVAAQVILAWQTLVSRYIDPAAIAVVSVTQVDAGEALNAIPRIATLRGNVRTLDPGVQSVIQDRMRQLASSICQGFGATCELDYRRNYPVLINTARETQAAVAAARSIVGHDCVDDQMKPSTGAEDFAFMLQKVPGCYILIGNGDGEGPGACMVHNGRYDFNDDIIALGATYWVRLVELALAPVCTP